MEVVLKTHVGHIRQVNEDSGEVIYKNDNILLALVADGMGGHQAGDIASKMAITKIKEAFVKTDDPKDKQGWSNWLLQMLQETNHSIYEQAMHNKACYGMGTTLVAVLVLKEYYIVAHVGDSRMYRIMDHEIEILTEDHSLVYELLRSGQITMEEAETHPQRNVITRALGTEEFIEVDIQFFNYTQEKYLLLCSDGLSNLVNEEQMLQVLNEDKKLESKASTLLQMALDAGGEDNITVILVQLDGERI